jgi:hypothetical protein
MALNVHAPTFTGTGPTLAAPTTSELVDASGPTLLMVAVGATATTITVVVPGTDQYGLTKPDVVIGPLTSVTRLIRLDASMADPATGLVTVQFSQVAGVTASLVKL